MYSHANMYGQPSFGSASFHQPQLNSYYRGSPSQYHHHQQQQQQYLPPPPPIQPPPMYYADPNAFRKHYMNQLSGLTFNSRPIIQSLSLLAQEYSRYAEIVVSCIDTHIRKVPPPMKLPAFYLLDAMSKNVYEPYARCFASVVAPLFLQTYSQVDDQIRNKMEEMLLTWRKGSPTNQELFGSVTQLAIERGVWGDGRTASISKNQVLSELHFAIGNQERVLQSNPYNADASGKLEVLHQLSRLVTDVGVSQEELKQILGQLRELSKPPPAPPAGPSSSAWPQPPAHYPQPRAPPSQPYPPPGYSPPQFVPPPPPAPIPTPPSVAPSIPNAENIAKILDSLKTAGVLAGSIPATTSTPPVPAETMAPDNAATLREYRASVLSQAAVFSSAEILRIKPDVAMYMYDSLASQCKQCGVRFPDSVSGRQDMDRHLDVHFGQNKRSNQNTGRGYSRTSFPDAETWIRDGSGSGKGKSRDDSSRTQASLPVKTEQELKAMFVVVPAGDEAKTVSCPICKETLKSEFKEDDEEWVWRNAVLKDDKIYHATCHVEALSSTSGIAARLRQDATTSSRGGTPDASGSRSTPPPKREPDSPSIGAKRKVESDTENAIGTPPLKKVALS